eukprot:365383-Chlamydomonas_euryale.AAC.3
MQIRMQTRMQSPVRTRQPIEGKSRGSAGMPCALAGSVGAPLWPDNFPSNPVKAPTELESCAPRFAGFGGARRASSDARGRLVTTFDERHCRGTGTE